MPHTGEAREGCVVRGLQLQHVQVGVLLRQCLQLGGARLYKDDIMH